MHWFGLDFFCCCGKQNQLASHTLTSNQKHASIWFIVFFLTELWNQTEYSHIYIYAAFLLYLSNTACMCMLSRLCMLFSNISLQFYYLIHYDTLSMKEIPQSLNGDVISLMDFGVWLFYHFATDTCTRGRYAFSISIRRPHIFHFCERQDCYNNMTTSHINWMRRTLASCKGQIGSEFQLDACVYLKTRI